MKRDYKVSMIVAIYNSEKFLPKLIDSILSQSYTNLEVILVDDGSPDKSGEICDRYAEQDDRIQVIHKENGGTCDARNQGLKACTGDYVLIIDGDDWLEEDFVEYLLSLAVDSNSDMAMSDKIFTTRDRIQTPNDQVKIITPEEATAMIIYPYMEIGPWNKIYKLQMIKDNDLSFSVKWSGEGLYFAAMAAQYSNRVALGHRKVYNYRLNNAGSGLTNYKVIMGLNALENIKLIDSRLIKRSPAVDAAVKWHIWKNNYFVMFLVTATDSYNEYSDIYNECKRYIRKNAFSVVIHSAVGKKEKMRMILKCMFPKYMALKEINRRKIALQKDLME